MAWLPDREFNAISERLSTDPERTVREAAERTRDEHRVRIDSGRYLSAVLSVGSGSTDEILNAWRFGNALTQTGDDACIRAIQKHLGSNQLRPNVRHWLRQILEGIENH